MLHGLVQHLPRAGLRGKEINAVIIMPARINTHRWVKGPSPRRSRCRFLVYQLFLNALETWMNKDVRIDNARPLRLVGADVHRVIDLGEILRRIEASNGAGQMFLIGAEHDDGLEYPQP